MGKETVKFRCHSTGHCCKDVVCLPTPFDVIRIVRATGENPYEFLEFLTEEEIEEVEEDDPTWLEVGGERYMMALRRGKKGCHFLNKTNNRCTIYEHRPILCRLYPFKLQETRKGKFKGFTLHKDVGCPRHRDGLVETAPLYALYQEDCKHQEDYNDLVAAFNQRKKKGKHPEAFIALFYENKVKKSKKNKKSKK